MKHQGLPAANSAQSSMGAVATQGRIVCVLILRWDSSLKRSVMVRNRAVTVASKPCDPPMITARAASDHGHPDPRHTGTTPLCSYLPVTDGQKSRAVRCVAHRWPPAPRRRWSSYPLRLTYLTQLHKKARKSLENLLRASQGFWETLLRQESRVLLWAQFEVFSVSLGVFKFP